MDWTDAIGAAFGAYQQREQNKLDLRLQQSREQIAAYEAASRPSGIAETAASMPKWAIFAGLAVAGVLVWVAVK